MPALDFDISYVYDSTNLGIAIPLQLVQRDRTIELTARLDTGCAHCLLDRFFAEDLGLNVESGIRQRYRTVAGSFLAYGHELTIRTLGLEWSAMIYFYAAADQHSNFVGRQGWLDRVRIAIIHYGQQLYLSHHNK
jgi:hypothetical protein